MICKAEMTIFAAHPGGICQPTLLGQLSLLCALNTFAGLNGKVRVSA
jgi:hypothetical protein